MIKIDIHLIFTCWTFKTIACNIEKVAYQGGEEDVLLQLGRFPVVQKVPVEITNTVRSNFSWNILELLSILVKCTLSHGHLSGQPVHERKWTCFILKQLNLPDNPVPPITETNQRLWLKFTLALESEVPLQSDRVLLKGRMSALDFMPETRQ